MTIAGFATRVDVKILKDGGITVTDDGRGMPVDKHPKTGLSALETVLTVLHAEVNSVVVVIKYIIGSAWSWLKCR